MISAYETHSFRRRTLSGKLGSLLKTILLLLLLYHLVTGVLVLSLSVGSQSMAPGLARGERILASPLPFGIPLPFLPERFTQYGTPERGDIVVLRSPSDDREPWHMTIAEGIVRFFTLNRVSLERTPAGRRAPSMLVKRVIGIPGDVVRVQGRVAEVRAAAAGAFVSEAELIQRDYEVLTELQAEGWSDELPFSGNTSEVVLGPGEFFLLGDNRTASSDSRAWGPVAREDIEALVLLRYWPPRRFGTP